MLFISASWLKTSRPPCRFIGPVALCVSARVVRTHACPCALKASRRHYNTIYLENIYKGLQTQTCSVVAVIDRVFSGGLKLPEFIFCRFNNNFSKIILLLHSFVKDGTNKFNQTVNCGGQTCWISFIIDWGFLNLAVHWPKNKANKSILVAVKQTWRFIFFS